MSQFRTPTPDPRLPNPPVPVPPANQQNGRVLEFKRARIFLFISLPILILIFSGNPPVISVITTMLILLGISHIFEPVSNAILKYTEMVLILLGKPFEWLWRFLFVRHLTSYGRWLKRHRRLIIDTVAIIAILSLLGTTTLHPSFATGFGNLNDAICLNTPLPWPSCASGPGVTLLADGVRIGLIMNNVNGPFDQSTKNQHETAIENKIFQENRTACKNQHITLVVVTTLSRTIESPLSGAKIGWQDLEGSYLAQSGYNATHPAHKLCLAIANLGTTDTADKTSPLVQSHPDEYALPQVMHQIAQLAQTDPSFRGIIGFPFSSPASEALQLRTGYQGLSTIPIISPSVSSDELANVPNFYRITSPNRGQGTALAQFFCDSLRNGSSPDSIAMLKDSSDVYSRNLVLAFNDAINKCSAATLRTSIPYTKGRDESIQSAVKNALSDAKVHFILFAGYDQDMDTLELAIHSQDRVRAITIIGGGGINIMDPTTHYSYAPVYATSSTGPLPETDAIAASFLQSGFFDPPFVKAIPSKLLMPTDALLAYDAVTAFAQTASKVPSGAFTQENFNSALKNISFAGLSGEVAFQGSRGNGHSSDRDQSAIYIACNDSTHNIHLITKYSAINDGTSPVQKLPLNEMDGASTCPVPEIR